MPGHLIDVTTDPDLQDRMGAVDIAFTVSLIVLHERVRPIPQRMRELGESFVELGPYLTSLGRDMVAYAEANELD